MQNKKTLYDLLELSPQASHEAIRAAFERLTQAYEAGRLGTPVMDADTHYNQIKDAFFTLGNPTRRARYDLSLNQVKAQQQQLLYEEIGGNRGVGRTLKWLALIVLVAGGLYYWKTARDVEIEHARLAAEAKQAELAALQKQDEIEQARSERELAAIEAQQERTRQYDFERARAEADANSYRLQQAQEEARREEERKRSQQAIQRKIELAQAQRRTELEKQAARRLEWERSASTAPKGSFIPNSTNSNRPPSDPRNATH